MTENDARTILDAINETLGEIAGNFRLGTYRSIRRGGCNPG
ncbi:hypothetical protein ACVWXM_009536 [Bradyrhizobium sp. GM7.3]